MFSGACAIIVEFMVVKPKFKKKTIGIALSTLIEHVSIIDQANHNLSNT